MNTISNSEFAKQVLLMAQPPKEFRPTATYDPDGDCIEFLAKPDAFYGERVDDLVTVYYSQETNEVIGSLVKGVSRFCKQMLQQMPGFTIEIQDGPVKLTHIFLAHLWSAKRDPQETVTLTYKKLIHVAEQTDVAVEGDLQLCA